MEEERTAQRKSGDILRIAIAEQKEQTNDNDNEEIERELIEQKAKTSAELYATLHDTIISNRGSFLMRGLTQFQPCSQAKFNVSVQD